MAQLVFSSMISRALLSSGKSYYALTDSPENDRHHKPAVLLHLSVSLSLSTFGDDALRQPSISLTFDWGLWGPHRRALPMVVFVGVLSYMPKVEVELHDCNTAGSQQCGVLQELTRLRTPERRSRQQERTQPLCFRLIITVTY